MNQSPLTEMLRKATGAERAWIVAYLRSHGESELAAAIAAGAHLRREPEPRATEETRLL